MYKEDLLALSSIYVMQMIYSSYIWFVREYIPEKLPPETLLFFTRKQWYECIYTPYKYFLQYVPSVYYE